MRSKPKNFSQALDELEKMADSAAPDLRSKIEKELAGWEEKFNALKPQFEEWREEVGKTKAKGENQVRERPLLTLGIVGFVFFVLGYIFSTRRRD